MPRSVAVDAAPDEVVASTVGATPAEAAEEDQAAVAPPVAASLHPPAVGGTSLGPNCTQALMHRPARK